MFPSTRVLLIAIMKLSTMKSIIADKHALPLIACKPLWVFKKPLAGFIKKPSDTKSCSDALTVESSICYKG